MKNLLIISLLAIILTGCSSVESLNETCTETNNELEEYIDICDKPVIYLYPEESKEVSVELDFDGELICTYPEYNNGWKVIAHPDGTLIDASTDKEYSYLFWEGVNDADYDKDFSKLIIRKSIIQYL